MATSNGWTTFSDFSVRGAHLADTMNGVSCSSATRCEAVGSWGTATTGYGVVAVSTNGGRTWSAQHASPIPHVLSAITCLNDKDCYAAGVKGGSTNYWSATTSAGTHWTDHTAMVSPSVGGLSAISCVSTTNCTMTDIRGTTAVTDTSGSTWSIGSAFSTTHWIWGLSCVAGGSCVAVGVDTKGKAQVLVSLNSGLTWRPATTPNVSGTLFGVTCLSASTCYAVGKNASHAIIWRTTNWITWSAMTVPAGASVLNAISCRTVSWCTAVGGNAANNADVFTLH